MIAISKERLLRYDISTDHHETIQFHSNNILANNSLCPGSLPCFFPNRCDLLFYLCYFFFISPALMVWNLSFKFSYFLLFFSAQWKVLRQEIRTQNQSNIISNTKILTIKYGARRNQKGNIGTYLLSVTSCVLLDFLFPPMFMICFFLSRC